MYYSLLGRDVERDTVAMMQHFGIGMTVWSPLAYGFLAGKYTAEDMQKDDNRFAQFDWLKFDRDQAFALLPILEEIAKARQCSMAQLAIAWLLTRPGVDSVLLGATKAHQLEDNLAAVNVALSEDDLARLDEATRLTPIYPSSDWVEIDPVARKRLGAHRK
jgi:aryl-alcohol dehydrogenase-like predicted oxidoreductase